MTLWQAAPWLGVLSDTDLCDKDVVIVQRCVLEKSEASWANAQFSSRSF